MMARVQDWRPVIRQVFGAVWLYAGFLVLWAVMAQAAPDRVPGFSWAWAWVPFQWVAWTCGAWFLLVAGAWGVIEVQAGAQRTWVRLTGRVRVRTTQTAPAGVVVPTMVYNGAPTVQDRPTVSLAQLVYDYMQTRPNHGGRAGELLDEMREAALFAIAGVPEPVDAADLSKQLDDAGWPKLPDKRRVGYPGMATGFRHVDQIDFDERCTFRPTP